MAMFHVGQKVVCVNAKPNDLHIWNHWPLRSGAIYSIRFVGKRPSDHEPGVLLQEIVGPNNPVWGREQGFVATRFRPVVERKTDISIFHEILRKNTKKNRVRA